jgi:hypothetical protein
MKVLFYFSVLIVSTTVLAQDKKGYSLFNPTPSTLFREFATDRPDKTESPYTVDAGRFQFETDLMNQTFNDDDGVKTTQNTYNNIILKAGLTHNMDFQLIVPTFVEERTETATSQKNQRGMGDTLLRLKINMFGNDEGDFAWGLIPNLKLPTAGAGLGNDHLEGGLLIPFAFKLPEDFSMGVMLGIDHFRNDADSGSETSYVMTWTIGHSIVGDLSGFIEVYNQFSDRSSSEAEATLDFGLTYVFAENWMVDAGYFRGITHAAPDRQCFVGLSARL